MNVRITYFVHGTTTDNENGRATGWNAGELSELGIQQSKELGFLVRMQTFDEVFCSDLKRAIDTAELAFASKHRIKKDERLREVNYGTFNGKKESFKNNLSSFVDRPFPNGESYKKVEKRMKSFLDDLKKNYDNKHIAVIAHQAPQLALEVLVNHKKWERAIAEDWRKVGKWQPGWEYFLR